MIASLQNPLVKRFVKLRDRKARDQQRVFLIEGQKELQLAVQAGIELEALALCPEINGFSLQHWQEQLDAHKTRCEQVTPDVYKKIAYRETVEGITAIALQPHKELRDITLHDNMLILVVDSVEKPGNLGALLRTADGAGFNAVIVTGQATDIYNPNTIRSSVGAVFTIPTLNAPAQDVLDWLTANNFLTVITSPDATQSYHQISCPPRTALVLGSEKDGLGNDWLSAQGTPVKIDMHGKMDSLNLSVSGGILMYHLRNLQSSQTQK